MSLGFKLPDCHPGWDSDYCKIWLELQKTQVKLRGSRQKIKTNEVRISELEKDIKIIDSRLGDGWFKSLVKALANKTE